MRVVVTGGIGTGKSFVVERLSKLLPDYRFANVDELVRGLYDSEEYKVLLRRLFGTVDRREISARVFSDGELKARFENETMSFLLPLLEPLLRLPKLILEFPLFFETARFAPFFHLSLSVGCSPETQLSRVMARDSISEERFRAVVARQHSSEVRSALSDFHISTDSGEASLDEALSRFVSRVRDGELRERCRSFFGSEHVVERVFSAYSEPSRFYHGVGHLCSLFAALDPFLEGHPYRDAVEQAVWYHDFVYSVQPGEYPLNEARSAKALWRDCSSLAPSVLERSYGFYAHSSLACEFILSTKGHAPSSPMLLGDPSLFSACSLFLDADISVLSGTPDEVDAYDEGVAREWTPVGETPSASFARARADALRSFLSRPRVFLSPEFSSLEEKARSNLDTLVRRWTRFASIQEKSSCA